MTDCSFFARPLYDNCNYYQDLHQSTSPLNYALLVDNYENKQNSNAVFPCNGSFVEVKCEPCLDNKEANITNTFDSVPYRTDIESELKLINYRLSRCSGEKFQPCQAGCLKCGSKGVAGALNSYPVCNKVIPTVALLCDRKIVPTNMKMPVDSGIHITK